MKTESTTTLTLSARPACPVPSTTPTEAELTDRLSAKLGGNRAAAETMMRCPGLCLHLQQIGAQNEDRRLHSRIAKTEKFLASAERTLKLGEALMEHIRYYEPLPDDREEMLEAWRGLIAACRASIADDRHAIALNQEGL